MSLFNRILFWWFIILMTMWVIGLVSGCKTRQVAKERIRTEDLKEEKLNSKINYQSVDTGTKQVTKSYQVSKITTRTVIAKGKNIMIRPDGAMSGVEDYTSTDQTDQTEKSDSASNEKFGMSINFQEEINRQIKEQRIRDSLSKTIEAKPAINDDSVRWPLIIIAVLAGVGFIIFLFLKGKK